MPYQEQLVERISHLPPTHETGESELLGQALEFYSETTAVTGVAAFKKIQELHGSYNGQPSTDVTDVWKHDIDGAASDAMAAKLAIGKFHTIKVGSEGDKEIHYAGIAAPSVKGEFNGGNGYPVLWGVSDVVEQTTRASRNLDGAASVLAITRPNGIKPTDPRVDYMMKLIGPPQARGIMSLDASHEENLDNLIQVLRIRPHELTQFTLNDAKRPMNTPFIEAAKKLGINLQIVDSGDLMPGIMAASDARDNGKGYFVVATRGGMEEGTIAALAARIQGGFMEARAWNKDPEIYERAPLWTLDDLAPERSEMALISVTGITGDKHLGIPAVERRGDGRYISSTMIISSQGRELIQHLHAA